MADINDIVGSLHLSNVTGLLDIDSMVNGILSVKAQRIQKLTQEKALYQAKVSSLSNLLGSINDLKSFVSSWDIESPFNAKTVSVENSDILSASVTSDAPDVTMKINVTQLPQVEMRVSTSGVSSPDDTLSASTFTLRYWLSDTEYEDFTINFSGGTLNDLVDAINNAQNRFKASIYYDGTSYKLMLTENDKGASTKETTDTSAVIEVASGALPVELGNLTTIQNAQNAKLYIGDSTEPVVSPTETFENLISGLTVTVKSTGETSLTISEDYSGVSSTLKDFIDKVNGLVKMVNELTKKGAIFQGNVTITSINTQIFRNLSPLIELGLLDVSDETGEYSVNTSRVTELAENNPELLKSTLSQVKQKFSNFAESLYKSFESYKNIENDMVERIDQEIKDFQEMLKQEELRLRKEFASIEALMYNNEQLKARLQSLAVPITQSNK